ncbi:UNVERIFIED_ORG: trimeric autotransporter adhesin [Burkholderia sp. CF145]|uniref:ESPR-type extended signal peptide-containing protein n=1 Tax=Paraburkholderia hospita TaxID=169430 RepID=UPI0002718365|nr:ESPR-type extended signal peptide-containing protein [Paraburkholderia hospita]EUC19450.1 Extended signal peptide region [Burkholderia sp. BT03]SKC68936.1 Head domain of trimeric autotransporter adhesin [Paraburkholderia hospita]
MNKTYRSVWNDATGTWVAVQENAKGHGKKKSRAAINLLATSASLVASMSAYATTLDGGSVAKSTQVAIGQNSKVTANTNDGGQGVAIGVNAISSGSYALAAGGSSNAAGNQSVALGNYAHTANNNTNAVGFASLAAGAGSNAIGAFSTASGDFSTAIGNQAFTSTNAVALGAGSKATTTNSVALGTNSVANSTTLGSAGFAPGGATLSAATAFGEVSVGASGSERRITNVAAGYSASDAVNVSQLMAEGARVNNLVNNISAGGNLKYFHANSTQTDSLASGSESIAVGVAAVSSGGASIAQGAMANASGNNSVALGAGANATGPKSVALGSGSVANSSTLGSAGFNAGSTALSAGTASGELSIGGVGSERRITNVAAGYSATDAVNVSQLMSEDAKVNNVSNNVSILSNTVNNIGGSISNINNQVTNRALHVCCDARRCAGSPCVRGQHQEPGRGAHACRAEDRRSLPSRCGGRLPRNR